MSLHGFFRVAPSVKDVRPRCVSMVRRLFVMSRRADVQRATDFQAMLKSRFAKELFTLQAVVI